jgi:hypothetical protein
VYIAKSLSASSDWLELNACNNSQFFNSVMSHLARNQLSCDANMSDESTTSSSLNSNSFAASKLEPICLPDDLATLDHASAQPDARATSAAVVQVPSALAHPAVMFDVLSASNIEALIESLEPLEQHALLVLFCK